MYSYFGATTLGASRLASRAPRLLSGLRKPNECLGGGGPFASEFRSLFERRISLLLWNRLQFRSLLLDANDTRAGNLEIAHVLARIFPGSKLGYRPGSIC